MGARHFRSIPSWNFSIGPFGLKFAISSSPAFGFMSSRADGRDKEYVMGFTAYLKDIVTILIITSLLGVGLYITLKSGVMAMSGDRCRLILGNLSRLILTLGGCLLFLTMVHEIVGLPIGLRW
jgi:hypothetical protein